MMNRLQLQSVQRSKKLLTLFAVFVIIDIFTRLMIISPQVNQPDFSKEVSLNKESTLLKESQWQQINDILEGFKPQKIEQVKAPAIKEIKTYELSEQGGVQSELFIGDLKLKLLAVIDEKEGKRFALFSEINLNTNKTVVNKYDDKQLVYGLILTIDSLRQVRFAHEKLSSDVIMSLYEK